MKSSNNKEASVHKGLFAKFVAKKAHIPVASEKNMQYIYRKHKEVISLYFLF